MLDVKDKGITVLRNVGNYAVNDTASHLKKQDVRPSRYWTRVSPCNNLCYAAFIISLF
jgi:hypothetical protein